ncbi:hypothetical protein JTE90_027743 [Oedothorax gibbosus]|uniref:Uncharacterized protein n=1 Tax=Oedothorax gibbosus TaxID=931172 RepID=A0AAV6TDZ2_9ARAC|nr:hypothetical protein JTE90_027743 [Oedothorax gibbosus]
MAKLKTDDTVCTLIGWGVIMVGVAEPRIKVVYKEQRFFGESSTWALRARSGGGTPPKKKKIGTEDPEELVPPGRNPEKLLWARPERLRVKGPPCVPLGPKIYPPLVGVEPGRVLIYKIGPELRKW